MFPSRQFYFGLLLSLLSSCVVAIKWRDTGGSIALEEAWTIPELMYQVNDTIVFIGGGNAELQANLLDIHNQRLAYMDTYNIDYMVISCTQPCIQGLADPDEAAAMAVTVNNQLAATIANNTERFGGFAALSMHNATVAAQELQRAVKELGFLGALINDYQVSGPDNNTLIYYDQGFDDFWQMVSDLNVPIYLHPRGNIPQVVEMVYAHAPYLLASPHEYAVTLSNHILGLCTNGVFDRFPNVSLIVGHLGERIPSDLYRIDNQLLLKYVDGLPMKKNITTYFHTNIYETTSGNFATDLLKFHMGQIGLDRILYSVDYPYVPIWQGADWLDTLPGVLSEQDLTSLKRGLAIKLLHLND